MGNLNESCERTFFQKLYGNIIFFFIIPVVTQNAPLTEDVFSEILNANRSQCIVNFFIILSMSWQ